MNMNWKTTAAGVGALIAAGASLFPGGVLTWSVLPTALPAAIAAMGLIFAKDSDVHSTPAEVKAAGVEQSKVK